jgi:putative oxidoreductase
LASVLQHWIGPLAAEGGKPMNALCNLARTYAPLLGRILVSILFLRSAIGKITGFSIVAAGMAKKGIPFSEVLLIGAIFCEIAGGLALVLGWKARWGALLLIIFMIPVTLLYHDFWNVEAAQYRNQLNHFMKNLTIFGALVFILGMGSGPLSLEKSKEPSGS